MRANRKRYYVYILSSKRNGTLYTGITNDIKRRISEHKDGVNESFTKKYGVNRLVHVEEYNDPVSAIAREKQIKGGSRKAKLRLIESVNPKWVDLAEGL
jgi:putative endonuclease